MVLRRGAILVLLSMWSLACGSKTRPVQSPVPEPDAGADHGPQVAPAPVVPVEPIRIGVYLPMTGPMGSFGSSALAGIELAVAEQNAAGGVRGATVEIVALDTMGQPAATAAVVERLIEHDRVVALVGEVLSMNSLAGAAVAQAQGVPMIAPSATAVDVTRTGDRIFRACFIDAVQARAMAAFAREHLKVSRVAILTDEAQAYSVGLASGFAAELRARGGTIVAEQRYQTGNTDPKALMAIKAARPEAIYVPGYYADVGTVAVQLRKIGVAVPLLGGDGWDSAELTMIAGSAIDGSYYTSQFAVDDPRAVSQAFVARFQEGSGTPPDSLAALGYDAVRIVLAAMARSPSLDRADLAEAMAATRLDGVTGPLTFDGDRDPIKPVAVLRFESGRPRLAATIGP